MKTVFNIHTIIAYNYIIYKYIYTYLDIIHVNIMHKFDM